MNIPRLLIGLIVSPLVPAFLMGILNFLFNKHHNNGSEIFIGAIISYILIFLMVLPIHFELEAKNRDSFRNYFISGLVAGCLLSLIPLLFLLNAKQNIIGELLFLFKTISIILTYTVSIFSSFWVIVKG